MNSNSSAKIYSISLTWERIVQFRVLAVRFCLFHRSFLSDTINSKINGTSKGVYLPISKQNSVLVVPNLLVHNNIP